MLLKIKNIYFSEKGWHEPEWGFPKGRRNIKENDFDCSLREYEEETGYKSKHLKMIKNIGYFDETFTGSNMKSYRHKYYLCKIDYVNTLNESLYEKSEIGDLKWFNYEDCMKKIRYYNYEKKSIFSKSIDYLFNNRYTFPIIIKH